MRPNHPSAARTPAATKLLVLWAACLVAAMVIVRPACAQEDAATPPGTAGLTIHLSPDGGRLMDSPPRNGSSSLPSEGVAESPADTPAAGVDTHSFSDAGLVAQPSPRGGVKVNLNGRFRSHATISQAPDGAVVRDCISSTPEAVAGH